jgi:hypothetical protein
MVTTDTIQLRSSGHDLDMDADCLGRYRDVSHLLDDVDALRREMEAEGHLYLPGYLDREQVLDARRSLTDRLAEAGALRHDRPSMEAVAAAEYRSGSAHPLARKCPDLEKVLYAGRMMAFFERFLGVPVQHYDYTWLRAVVPGIGTPTHCDVVYMGRGARSNLYTAWTPLGEIDLAMGGLMILERSHRIDRLRETYGSRDVDTYCANRPSGEKVKAMFGENGTLAPNPRQIRRSLGGRWLVGEFQPGDLIVFNVFTVHGGLDNQSDRLRLSTDSRYQPADEPIDERWMGSDPPAHGPRGKRAMVC